MRKSLVIVHVIDFQHNETGDLATTLDDSNTAVYLVAADGQIIFANELASGTIANTYILRVSEGRLSILNKMASKKLRDVPMASGCLIQAFAALR